MRSWVHFEWVAWDLPASPDQTCRSSCGGSGRPALGKSKPGFARSPDRGVRGYVGIAGVRLIFGHGPDVGATNSFRIYKIFINF